MLNKYQKCFLLLSFLFLAAIFISNVSFAANDIVDSKKTSGLAWIYCYKGVASNYNVKIYSPDKVYDVATKNNKRWYIFTSKKKNLGIKSISMKYKYYDQSSGIYKTVTKKYSGKNKKSVSILLSRYVRNWAKYGDNKYYSYAYAVLKFSIKYSNNKIETSSKFSEKAYQIQRERVFNGKKTSVKRLFTYLPGSMGYKAGNPQYTIQAKNKAYKIKKVAMKFSYNDSKNVLRYKTVSILGKSKNTVVCRISDKYEFKSATILY